MEGPKHSWAGVWAGTPQLYWQVEQFFCWHMRNCRFSTEILDITVTPPAASFQSFFIIISVSLGWPFTFPVVELFQVLLKPSCSRSRFWNSTGKHKQISQLPYLIARQRNINYKLYLVTRFFLLETALNIRVFTSRGIIISFHGTEPVPSFRDKWNSNF